MTKLTFSKKLPLAVHSFGIRDHKSGKMLVSESWVCDGVKIRREDLSRFHPDDQLVVDGQIEGKLIHVFKE
jgi:hypothetical protein